MRHSGDSGPHNSQLKFDCPKAIVRSMLLAISGVQQEFDCHETQASNVSNSGDGASLCVVVLMQKSGGPGLSCPSDGEIDSNTMRDTKAIHTILTKDERLSSCMNRVYTELKDSLSLAIQVKKIM